MEIIAVPRMNRVTRKYWRRSITFYVHATNFVTLLLIACKHTKWSCKIFQKYRCVFQSMPYSPCEFCALGTCDVTQVITLRLQPVKFEIVRDWSNIGNSLSLRCNIRKHVKYTDKSPNKTSSSEKWPLIRRQIDVESTWKSLHQCRFDNLMSCFSTGPSRSLREIILLFGHYIL